MNCCVPTRRDYERQPERPGFTSCARSLYALDALDSGEKQQFEAHLRDGCDACQAELRSLQAVTVGISTALAVDPPAQLRDRLMARVARTPRMPGIAYNESGLLIARSQEINWQILAPGISYKTLYRDRGAQL